MAENVPKRALAPGQASVTAMPRKQTLLITLAMVVGLALALLLWRTWTGPLRPENLVIATGNPGGTYHLFGRRLAQILEDREGVGAVSDYSSKGTLENITRVVKGATALPSRRPRTPLPALFGPVCAPFGLVRVLWNEALHASQVADLAMAMAPVLAADERHEKVRVLMSLYTDRIQIVTRRDAEVRSLRDLRGKSIFIGAPDSGTRQAATEILGAAGVPPGTYETTEDTKFMDASNSLRDGRAEAAFFVSSLPAKAVAEAMADGCCRLLGVDPGVRKKMMRSYSEQEIPARTYENQEEGVLTLGGAALLIARSNLPDEIAAEIVDAVFDSLGAFAEAKVLRAQDMIEDPFALPEGLVLHPGVEIFRKRDRQRVLIATGSLNGKYYHIGKRIEAILRLSGIPARVIETDGSFENLEMLEDGIPDHERRPTLAIVQYDAALAAFWGTELYAAGDRESALVLPEVKSLRRIATLHEEVFHAVVRRKPPQEDSGARPTLGVLAGKSVAMGAKGSGTRVLSEALLREHGIRPAETPFLTVSDMLEQLNSEELHGGFFVGHVPSEALKSVVQDDSFRLLSVEPRSVAGLLGPALNLTRIEPGTYGAQREGEPPIDTVGTWAVLVTRNDLKCAWTLSSLFAGDRLGCDVKQITRAVFEGAAFLGIDTDPKRLARDLSSLPLHPRAELYYRKAGFLPSGSINWLTALGNLVAILAVAAGGYRSLLAVRRERTRRLLSQRILDVPLGAAYPRSVTDLMELRREVRRRSHHSSWRAGQLDSGRATKLERQIAERIEEAKERLKQGLLVGIRALGQPGGLDRATVEGFYSNLERTVWSHLESGELDPHQHQLLIAAIQEGRKAIAERA